MKAVLVRVDIKRAYIQTGPIKRTVNVRPPHELGVEKVTIWRLTKMLYGITEERRQWELVFEHCITTAAGLKGVSAAGQIFVKRDSEGSIAMMMEKVSHDLLMIVTEEQLKTFVDTFGKHLPISKAIIDDTICFNACLI